MRQFFIVLSAIVIIMAISAAIVLLGYLAIETRRPWLGVVAALIFAVTAAAIWVLDERAFERAWKRANRP